ncbi:MAG TPA: cohesin domain-containing protein [Bryobacteraceae bacterium]
MKNNTFCTLFPGMAVAAILLLAPATLQGSSIGLQPSTTVATVGDIFSLDLMADGLAPGAYDLTVAYNPLLVSIDPALVTFDAHLGGSANSFAFVNVDLDTFEVGEVSFLTDPADLAALQTSSSFPLAHIQVKTLQAGTAAFDFRSMPFMEVSDYSGASISGVAFEAASVLIRDPEAPPATVAPEPSSLFLIVTGVFLVIMPRMINSAVVRGSEGRGAEGARVRNLAGWSGSGSAARPHGRS